MSPPRDLAWFRLKEEVEDFLYGEADLLDQRRFGDWLALLADDLHYFMPMRRNVPFGTHAEHENTRAGQDISWFDEDKWTLSKRVDQSAEEVQEVEAGSRFLVYQNRVETETYLFAGRRHDLLRRTPDGWKLARREILLDQNVLLAKNLTVFF